MSAPSHRSRAANCAYPSAPWQTAGGDTKELTDALGGYQRLRVGPYRIIYREAFEKGGRVVKCLFAERRAVVYELFTELVVSDLT